jgi:hypothetical protein
MSLAAFPHSAASHPPLLVGGKLLSADASRSVPRDPQPHPQGKPFLESDFRGFPQMHSASLQYKRYLFPLRNE